LHLTQLVRNQLFGFLFSFIIQPAILRLSDSDWPRQRLFFPPNVVVSMSSVLAMKKLQFVVLAALVVLATAMLANASDGKTFPSWGRPLFGVAGMSLVVILAFKFAQSFKADKKPEEKDVFDYTDRTTSSAVLGKLAEIKYGERKKRDRFEDYYKIR